MGVTGVIAVVVVVVIEAVTGGVIGVNGVSGAPGVAGVAGVMDEPMTHHWKLTQTTFNSHIRLSHACICCSPSCSPSDTSVEPVCAGRHVPFTWHSSLWRNLSIS